MPASPVEDAVFDLLSEGVVVANRTWEVVKANRLARELMGVGERGWTWAHHLLAPNGQPFPLAELPLVRALRGEVVDGVEVVVRREDGTERHVLCRAHPVPVPDSRTGMEGNGAVVFFRDITRRKEAEKRYQSAQRRANEDVVTGLATRAAFLERLRETLAEARPCVVLGVDLDGFRDVNNDYDHASGDVVLRVVADRLKRCVRPSDIVGRWGGDEFVVALPGLDVAREACEVAERIRAAVAQPIGIAFKGQRVDAMVTASIGIALSTPEETAEELVHRADQAERAAKADGKDRVRFAP